VYVFPVDLADTGSLGSFDLCDGRRDDALEQGLHGGLRLEPAGQFAEISCHAGVRLLAGASAGISD
jgi:hypothetical protein